MNGHVKPDEIRMMQRILEIDAQEINSAKEWWSYTELDQLSLRWAYILDKWERKGWYEYGVAMRVGWLTKEGREALPRVIEETKRRYVKMVTKSLTSLNLIESAGLGTVQRNMSGCEMVIDVMLKPALDFVRLDFSMLANEMAPKSVFEVATQAYVVRQQSEKVAEHYRDLAGFSPEVAEVIPDSVVQQLDEALRTPHMISDEAEEELPDTDEEDPLSSDAVQAYESSIAESLANIEADEEP